MRQAIPEGVLVMSVSVRDIRKLAENISDMAAVLGILEGGEWTRDSSDHIPEHLEGSRYRFPHLVLDEGSVTYGRAWRLNGSGGDKYRTAHYDPLRLGSGYLGSTKVEAYRCLQGLSSALWLAMDEGTTAKYWERVNARRDKAAK
jgi:hypothetical protein